LGCAALSLGAASAQDIDPFYLERLISGERAFLDGNYETAVEELKIALFGVQTEKQLKAKAYLFLGMSHYHLDEKAVARTYLKDAQDYLGTEGLRDLVPDDAVWFYLNRVLADLKLAVPGKPEAAGTGAGSRTPAQKPVSKQGASPNAAAFARGLEMKIKADPQNIALYYELYEHYMENDNNGAAKRTLESLIKKNPDEARGYYLLGRMQYRERDLRNAERNLGRVFGLQLKVAVEEFVLLEAKIFQILTTLLSGEKTRAYEMYAEWSDQLTEERIRFLELEEQERAIFQGIVVSAEAQAAIERLEGAEATEDAGPGENSAPTTMENDPSTDQSPDNIVPLDEVDTPPVLKERVDPRYPAAAVEREIEGTVVVSALISETGDVLDVVIVQGLAGGFNEETINAVMQWKYEPAVKDGQAVKVRKQISITFKARF